MRSSFTERYQTPARYRLLHCISGERAVSSKCYGLRCCDLVARTTKGACLLAQAGPFDVWHPVQNVRRSSVMRESSMHDGPPLPIRRCLRVSHLLGLTSPWTAVRLDSASSARLIIRLS